MSADRRVGGPTAAMTRERPVHRQAFGGTGTSSRGAGLPTPAEAPVTMTLVLTVRQATLLFGPAPSPSASEPGIAPHPCWTRPAPAAFPRWATFGPRPWRRGSSSPCRVVVPICSAQLWKATPWSPRPTTAPLRSSLPGHGAAAGSREFRGPSEAGQALAHRARARHRLVVDLLVAVGVPTAVAEADAEGMEHHVSDAALEAFARFLGRRPGA